MAVLRRERGSRVKPKVFGFTIEEESSEQISKVSQRMGTSRSHLIDLLIEHLELTDEGVPTWWTPQTKTTELDGMEGNTHNAA